MPEDFKVKYRSTRAIIDCTEVRCQMPNSMHLNGELFSNYKHRTTLKSLIGISRGGAVTFISQLFTGSISDREILVRSGFLDLPFKDNDSVMADKGFTVQDLLPLGVSFLGSSSQMPACACGASNKPNKGHSCLGWGNTSSSVWDCKSTVDSLCSLGQCSVKHYICVNGMVKKIG